MSRQKDKKILKYRIIILENMKKHTNYSFISKDSGRKKL
jgi:hypothetical protein